MIVMASLRQLRIGQEVTVSEYSQRKFVASARGVVISTGLTLQDWIDSAKENGTSYDEITASEKYMFYGVEVD